ncbi:ParB/RepB/Spo0J family partition protein [Holdemanella biformis]|uniref:ParB/RepB/Spo0J family partition protein n=1 Tax=Holdemanella biformis TaxID=1735 RepID=UPI000EBBB12D|nr:ParB/RepB/Spo0J family partition protein [uncultured Holdemanella sp.]MBU9896456.1 ParB/RepB/Spo0J family partition protein [Holdemanella biformis]MBV3417546.1 ParB/RepB/Spo0J family partition protein [Holdemanella biformis]HCR68967.1 chromosome partitioning protein ParB [Erysipelotrichaceae bacterium]
MANLPKLDLGLPSYDSLFSTEEERQEANTEKVMTIPINKIKDFEGHPFHVTMDEDMAKLIDSIKENDMLMPALVRPKPDGTYEMISGHRRKFAMSQLGRNEMNVIIRDLDDDQATILMVDSNIQRENIYPSERGYAYKMRLEAMKHQGKKVDINVDDVHVEYDKPTSAQVGPKLIGTRTNEILAEQLGISKNQIKRFIRLTYLVEPLQEMVDGRNENDIKIAFNPAVELSYLTESEQFDLVNAIIENQRTPSLAQCQEFKRLSHDGELTADFIEDTLSEEKPNQREKLSFQMKEIDKYFPKEYTPGKKKDLMIHLLESWAKKRSREQER